MNLVIPLLFRQSPPAAGQNLHIAFVNFNFPSAILSLIQSNILLHWFVTSTAT